MEWFAANPRFEKLLVRVSSRARVLLAFAQRVRLELENGCDQHKVGAGGGGGIAGIAQREWVRVLDRAVAGSSPVKEKRESSCAFPGIEIRVRGLRLGLGD